MKRILFFILFLGLAPMTQFESLAQEPSVVVPNVFTPNGDGVNDLFMVRTIGYSELECVIYNRYGAQVYKFEGINGDWDGRSQSGMICESGVYTYLIRASNADGGAETFHGNLHLIRD